MYICIHTRQLHGLWAAGHALPRERCQLLRGAPLAGGESCRWQARAIDTGGRPFKGLGLKEVGVPLKGLGVPFG